MVVDEAIKRLQPGQDQFVGIFDLKGFSMANVDLSFATFVIDAFLAMYPGRWVQLVWGEGGRNARQFQSGVCFCFAQR